MSPCETPVAMESTEAPSMLCYDVLLSSADTVGVVRIIFCLDPIARMHLAVHCAASLDSVSKSQALGHAAAI